MCVCLLWHDFRERQLTWAIDAVILTCCFKLNQDLPLFPCWPSEVSRAPSLFVSLGQRSGWEGAEELHSLGPSDWKEANQRHPLLKLQDSSDVKQTWWRCCCLELSSPDPAASRPQSSLLAGCAMVLPWLTGALQFLRCWYYCSCSYISI